MNQKKRHKEVFFNIESQLLGSRLTPPVKWARKRRTLGAGELLGDPTECSHFAAWFLGAGSGLHGAKRGWNSAALSSCFRRRGPQESFLLQ